MILLQSMKRDAEMRDACTRRSERRPKIAAWGVYALSAAGLFIGTAAMAATPIDPSGLWWTKENESIIKIAPCGSNYCGTIAWLKEPNEKDGTPKLDRQNSDATKRKRAMLGMEILLDMAVEKDHWAGKAYNPDDGKTYDITFKVNADKTPATGTIRGCLLIFCQSETFTHADAIPGAPPAAAAGAPPARVTPAKR